MNEITRGCIATGCLIVALIVAGVAIVKAVNKAVDPPDPCEPTPAYYGWNDSPINKQLWVDETQ